MPRSRSGAFFMQPEALHHFNRQPKFGGVLSRPGLFYMIRKRGNPNWGRPMLPGPALATAFEIEVRQLHLMPETYTSSAVLRNWCERNRTASTSQNGCLMPGASL